MKLLMVEHSDFPKEYHEIANSDIPGDKNVTHCNTLQHTATRSATYCNTHKPHILSMSKRIGHETSTFQDVAPVRRLFWHKILPIPLSKKILNPNILNIESIAPELSFLTIQDDMVGVQWIEPFLPKKTFPSGNIFWQATSVEIWKYVIRKYFFQTYFQISTDVACLLQLVSKESSENKFFFVRASS